MRKNLISTIIMLPMPLLMFFFFSVMYVWLGSVDSHVNRDFGIQDLEKVISQGVNKNIMEHFVKFYR